MQTSLKSGSASIWIPRLAIIFLALLFSVNVYRAWTQALTTDEAYTYTRIVGAQPFALFSPVESNYHVLHAMLCYVSIHLFGLSEFTFRLPSLLGCGLYFAAIYRISRLFFGNTPVLLLSVALLTVNPLLLDHMSVSRGYGLALAFFSWALYQSLIYQPGLGEDRVLYRAGILLGLTVASSLTFVYPALALAALLAALVFRSQARESFRKKLWVVVDQLVGPGLVTAFLFLALSLEGLSHPPGDFYGKASFAEMAESMLTTSLRYRDCFPSEYAGCFHPLLTQIGYWAALLILCVCLGSACVLSWRRWRANTEKLHLQNTGLVPTATLILTAILIRTSSALLGTPYPYWRRGLYFVFLVLLCLLSACRWLWSKDGWPRATAWMWTACLTVLALAMASQFDYRYYVEWRFDAGNREIVNRIRVLQGDKPGPARLAASWPVNWAIEAYREMYGLHWMAPVDDTKPGKGFDYYILRRNDSHYVAELGLRTIFVSEVSGTLLAVP